MTSTYVLLQSGTGQGTLLRQAFFLWAGLSAIGLVLVLTVWWLLTGWTRQRFLGSTAGSRRKRRIKDAWSEAGKRAPTPEPGDLEPDQREPS